MGIPEIIIILIVAASAIYLFRKLRSQVKDHDCGDCSLNEEVKKDSRT